MPAISLLDPVVLRGVVEKFMTPANLIMLNRLDQTPWPFPTVTWDVIKGSRMIASPNVPNSEAHIVHRLGRSQESAAFVYLREKKVFSPTTLHWLRTPGQLAQTNAELAVLREINDLNQRFDNFAEYLCWQALTGALTLDFPDVQASVNYQFPTSHIVTSGNPWNTATPVQLVQDIRAWKRIIMRHGRVPAKTAFATELTMAYIFDSFAAAGVANTFLGGTLLSDNMKDQYYREGTLPGFMGLDWTATEQVYENAAGNLQLFVPDNSLYIGNYDDQRPMELFIGPTADDEAPEQFTGKYAKTWKEKDPSARQYLLEWNIMPVITRPEQMLYVANVTSISGAPSAP
jgi:hypothetical protein